MTISITKIPKVGVQLLEWGTRLHTHYVWQYTGVRNGYTCYLLIQQRMGEWRQQTKCVESHIIITSGYSNLHDITNPITKIPNTGVQRVRLHAHYVWQYTGARNGYTRHLQTPPSHPTLAEAQGCSWRMLTGRQTGKLTRLKCVAVWTFLTGCIRASRTTMLMSAPEYLSCKSKSTYWDVWV